MIDIQLTGLVKEFEVGRKILDGFSLQVDTGERVGLLGRNGAGKTTIFRIITGEVEADEGTVTIAPGKRVGLISQIPVYPEGYTVEDVLDTAFERLHNIERELAELGMKMGDHPTQSVMERYDKLTAAFEAGGRAAAAVLGDAKDRRRVAVVGDMKELGANSAMFHQAVGGYFAQAGVERLIAIGDLAKYMAQGAVQAGMSQEQVSYFHDLEEAKEALSREIRAGVTILVKASRSMAFEKIVDYLTAQTQK